jgi:hypothetical protein
MASTTTRPHPQAPGRVSGAASPVAWTPGQELDANEWAAAGRRIGAVGRCIQWLLGDWIAYGNAKFGERYARASKISGYDPQTLMNMVYVASRFEISRRRENLSWSHHETIAALHHEEQDRWLDQAEANRWSVADLRVMLRVSRREDAEREGEPGEDMAPPAGSQAVVAGAEAGGLAAAAAMVCPQCGYELRDHAGEA